MNKYLVIYDFEQRAYPCFSASIIPVNNSDEIILSDSTYAFQYFESSSKLNDISFCRVKYTLEEQVNISNISIPTYIGKYAENEKEIEMYLRIEEKTFEKNRYIVFDDISVPKVDTKKNPHAFILISLEEAEKYRIKDFYKNVEFKNWYY